MKSYFNLTYFEKGPYKGAKIEGVIKYFGKYFWARRFYAQLISRLTPKKGKILELGCGFGDLLKFLEEDFHCTGTDISEDAIEKAKLHLKKSTLRVIRSEELYKLGKVTFNTIVANHILEHLKNPEAVIKEVTRHLKEKGIFFMVMPDPASLAHKFKKEKWIGFSDKTHISLYKPERWIELLIKHGFIIKKTFSDGFWDSPYLPYIPTFIQKAAFTLPALIQTLSTLVFIPKGWGESVIIIARKK